jgi:hypothetical protein
MLSLIIVGTVQARHRPMSPAQKWARGAFATCVRIHESQDGLTAQNLYEIEGPHASGNYGDYGWLDGVSRYRQNEIAYQLFRRSGDSPWRPYDGCVWRGN